MSDEETSLNEYGDLGADIDLEEDPED